MLNRTISLLVLLAIPILSAAQESEKLILNLQKAKAIANQNHPEIKAGILDKNVGSESIAEAKLKRWPQLNADFNVQRNLIIPVTPVPANAFNPNAPVGDLIPLRFTTRWTANSGLNASIDLFNPQKKLAIKEAQIQQEITEIENTNNINQINYEVGKAYIEALIASEQLRLAVADTLRQHELLQISLQQFEKGRLLLAALNQVKGEKNHALNNWEEAANIYDRNKLALLYNMGYDPNDNIEIAFSESLEDLFTAYQSQLGKSLVNSYPLALMKKNEASLNAKISATLNEYIPSITLKGYYGSNYYDNDFELFKSQNWNGNSFINLGIKLPITELFEKQKKLNQWKLQIKAAQLRYENDLHKGNLDFLNAKREAQALEKNYSRAKENFKLASENLALASQQFAAGRLLITELNEVNYAFQKEKNTYLNIAYNYIAAQLTLEKLSL